MNMKRISGGCIFAPWFCASHAMPATGTASGSPSGQRVNAVLLDKLQKYGYDVSDIRAALARGDPVTAGNLMQEFRIAHPDLILQPA